VPLLRCPGVFACPAPEGWTVTGVPGDYYVMTPPSGQGEVRLAVFDRDATPLADDEGRDRLGELLTELGVDPDADDVFVRVRSAGATQRAMAWFDARDADGRDVDCLAAIVVWPGAVIAATAMAGPRYPGVISTGELVVVSISPDDSTRGHRR
jgi:hypothetical protein